MLLTPEGAGARATMRARPMHVAQLDDDCTLTFLTSVETSKVEEAAGGAGAMVVAQSATRFASITGRTEVVRDQARIHAAWSPADKVYFPKGKDDPNLCLVVFHPQEAELWDTAGANGLRFLFDAARALLTGAAPKHDAETHARVSLGTA
jgi:general stress protein 26